MAEVFLAEDVRLHRTVAVKVLRSDLARDSDFQERFRREAQSAAALNHPSIVAVYDTGEEHQTTITGDRKSTRLNSSHVAISHAVFCLKKKKRMFKNTHRRQQKQTRNTEEVVQESHPGQQYSQR